jgi:hypothetical protein
MILLVSYYQDMAIHTDSPFKQEVKDVAWDKE